MGDFGDKIERAEGENFDEQLASMEQEIAALEANPQRTPDEDTRLEALKKDAAIENGGVDGSDKEV